MGVSIPVPSRSKCGIGELDRGESIINNCDTTLRPIIYDHTDIQIRQLYALPSLTLN